MTTETDRAPPAKTDVRLLVERKIHQMSGDGSIERMVSAAVEAAVQRAIEESFSRYSGFAKSIEKAITDTVRVDVDDLGLPGYNALVSQIIRAKLGHFFERTATQTIEREMTALLTEFPVSITVSELRSDAIIHVVLRTVDRD